MAENLRKTLRSNVRSAWSSDDGFNVQELLKEKGRSLLKEGYRKCATEKPAKEFKTCLADIASDKNISKEYRSIWGTA